MTENDVHIFSNLVVKCTKCNNYFNFCKSLMKDSRVNCTYCGSSVVYNPKDFKDVEFISTGSDKILSLYIQYIESYKHLKIIEKFSNEIKGYSDKKALGLDISFSNIPENQYFIDKFKIWITDNIDRIMDDLLKYSDDWVTKNYNILRDEINDLDLPSEAGED